MMSKHGKNKKLLRTSELANKAEVTILSAQDTTRAWVPAMLCCYLLWSGDKIKVLPQAIAKCVTDFLPQVDVFCHLLLLRYM